MPHRRLMNYPSFDWLPSRVLSVCGLCQLEIWIRLLSRPVKKRIKTGLIRMEI